MRGRMVRTGEPVQQDAEGLDERTRLQYLAVLQYLRDHELWESLSALELETGLTYDEGVLPVAGVLEASLDMFAQYRAAVAPSSEDTAAREAEEALLQRERGACCTGPCAEGTGPPGTFSANVTAVAWAAVQHNELLVLAATADRRLRLLGGPDGEVLAELTDLPSPLLWLDCAALGPEAAEDQGQEVLATAMGGEVLVIRLRRPPADWSLEIVQRFRDHTKHATCGRFAPPAEEGLPSRHFVSTSRDHQARLYARGASEGAGFAAAGVVRLVGEVTSCCWVSDRTFVVAARDDHHLHYWDVDGGADGGPQLRCKVNMNALGDSVVSFTVLALAVSPDQSMVAVCTDKSRAIIFQAYTPRQLRNLYGAHVDEYDVPSLCFSLDQTFLYVTSSLPHTVRRSDDGDEGEAVQAALPGEVAVFEVSSGERVLRLSCHERPVRCMDRHPHTELLVTGSFDKSVRYWG